MPAYVGSRKNERLERGGFKAIAEEIRSAVAHLEGGDEGGLRDFDLAELTHPLLPLLLLFEELAFPGHVAAIAFGEHVLAQGLDGLARDDTAADRRLDRDGEELARDQVLQSLA